MASRNPPRRFGLGDVLDIAMRGEPDVAFELPRFGAAGAKGAGVDPEMGYVARTSSGSKSFGPDLVAARSPHPMDRMFGTRMGQESMRIIGNESRTLEALQRISLEIMARALHQSGQVKADERLLAVPGRNGRPSVLMRLSPSVENAENSRVVSDEMDLPLPMLLDTGMMEMVDEAVPSPEAAALRSIQSAGPEALAQLFLVAQPEIVLTRRPRMIPLCVPSPHMEVKAGGQLSTAGVLCVDASGELGVTACYHGTGPVGTPVTVGGESSQVKLANPVQDTVFIPLRDRSLVKAMIGAAGVRQEREPARADPARFDGAVNHDQRTRIFSTDTGLLRARPTIMLKLQTDADTDQGDSGCALLDEDDRVLGFAFERTAYDDYPQFTDWIWAANALRALNLTPYRKGG